MADYISVQEAFKTAAQYGKDYTDTKVNPLAEEIAVVSRAVDEKIAPIAREVDSLGDVVAKNTADITEQKDAVDKINDELDDIKYDVSAQTTRIGELYREVEKATSKVDSMAIDVGVLKSNKADKTYVDNIDSKYSSEIRRVDGKIDSTKAEVETELGDLKEEIEQVSEDVSIINDSVIVDISNDYMAVDRVYINADGSTTSSNNWRSYKYDATKIDTIYSAMSNSNSGEFLQIAFYSDEEASADTFISGVAFDSSGSKIYKNNIPVPDDAKIFYLENRSATSTLYNISATLVRKSIEQISARVGKLEDSVEHIDTVIIETVEPLQKQADATDRSLDALWKLNKGQTYDIEEKTENGMSDAPSGSEYLSLEEVYGKSEQNTYQGYQLSQKYDVTATPTGKLNSACGTFGYAEEGKTYTLRFYNLTDSNAYTDFRVGSTSQKKANIIPNRINTVTFTATVSGNVCFNNDMGTSLANMKVFDRIMLEEGDTAHDFEPYVGNEPSPSPEYPQEIRSITELHFIHEGANLFETVSSTGDLISLVNSSGQARYGQLISGLKEQVYIKPFSESYDKNLYVVRYDVDGNITSTSTISASGVIVTDLSDFAIISNISNKTDTLTRLQSADIMMVYGDTAPTEYEPYSKEEKVITPPFPMNAIGSYKDMLDVDNGVWVRRFNVIKLNSLNWKWASTSGGRWNVKVEDKEIYEVRLRSSHFLRTTKTMTVAEMEDMTIKGNTSTTDIYIKDSAQAVDPNNIDGDLLYLFAEAKDYPISADDLDFLKSLELLPATHRVEVTNQNGEPIEWLAEYIISLREVH